jgi:hypothetical protein
MPMGPGKSYYLTASMTNEQAPKALHFMTGLYLHSQIDFPESTSIVAAQFLVS